MTVSIEIIVRGESGAGDVSRMRRWTLAPGQDAAPIFRQLTATLNRVASPGSNE